MNHKERRGKSRKIAIVLLITKCDKISLSRKIEKSLWNFWYPRLPKPTSLEDPNAQMPIISQIQENFSILIVLFFAIAYKGKVVKLLDIFSPPKKLDNFMNKEKFVHIFLLLSNLAVNKLFVLSLQNNVPNHYLNYSMYLVFNSPLFLSNTKSYYIALRLFGSRIIESAAYCAHKLLFPLYLNSI